MQTAKAVQKHDLPLAHAWCCLLLLLLGGCGTLCTGAAVSACCVLCAIWIVL